jgi:hypothetical protein
MELIPDRKQSSLLYPASYAIGTGSVAPGIKYPIRFHDFVPRHKGNLVSVFL